ncbi:MAG TPA: helical backbone metal receptor [Vicinamibacterales bacterium]|nr:helical backbone metal receptor [Vicinamibacterales bacterium]
MKLVSRICLVASLVVLGVGPTGTSGTTGTPGPWNELALAIFPLKMTGIRFLGPDVPVVPDVPVGPTSAVYQRSSPRRIISIIPAVTEMLFAMGAGEQVVGVSSYDRYPAAVASRERVGALLDPNVERIFALKPDLVVVYGTQQELIARLDRAGVPTFGYQHAGLADITITIRRLGQRVGRSQEAERLAAQIERNIEEIRQRVSGRPRPRTALLFDRESGTLRGMYASAGVGFMHDMLEVAGGADAFADVKRQSLQLSAEMLLARAPEVIVEIQSSEGWNAEKIERERTVWQTLTSVPAVRTGRIHILADDRLSIPGPRVADAIRLLARVLHPAAFGAQ